MKQHPQSASSRDDRTLGGIVFLCSALIFLPTIKWVFDLTQTHSQALHAFIILAGASAFLIYERRERLTFHFQLNKPSVILIAVSYLLLALIYLVHQPLLIFPSFCTALASFGLFLFGRERVRIISSIIGAFFLFLTLILFLPVLDWPLRTGAGVGSAEVLSFLGHTTDLKLYTGQPPALILINDGQNFHVAPECNGFGVITASALLSLLLVLYRRISYLSKFTTFVLAIISGFIFNTLRIVIIVMLAPKVGMQNYHIMHEIVGLITYYSCLILVWFFIMKWPQKKKVT